MTEPADAIADRINAAHDRARELDREVRDAAIDGELAQTERLQAALDRRAEPAG